MHRRYGLCTHELANSQQMIQSRKLALSCSSQDAIAVIGAEQGCSVAHPHIQRLHAAKERIGHCDRQAWLNASRQSNPHEELIAMLRTTLRGGIICRAEAKMWEMLHEIPSLLPRGVEVKAVHVADAPGGFANAALRRCDRKGVGHAGWVGMTLRGTEGALAYDASLDMSRAELFWGADGTGDLTSLRNLESLFDAHGASAHLFTADGGFDTHDAPELQEAQSAPLILAEAVAAIGCCREGGNAVIKVFECITPMSLSTLALLATHFKEVRLIKPLTSRPANSERYAVCLSREPGEQGEQGKRLAELVPVAAQFSRDGKPWRLTLDAKPDALAATEAAFSLRQAIAIERALAVASTKTPQCVTEAQTLRMQDIVDEWLR